MQFADFHCDTLLKIYWQDLDFKQHNSWGHLDFPRLRQAGFVCQCFAVFVDPRLGQEAMLRQTLRLIHLAQQKIFSHPDVQLVKGAADLERIKAGKLAGLLALEGADFVGDDLFLLDLVHHLGVRLITLTWNGRNSLADGVGLGDNGGGLTGLGQDAVARMQELGIIVDVSHLHERGFWDVAALATRPFVASHSNARAVCDHPRNLSDRQIRELAQGGGIIGINLCPSFIAAEKGEQNLAAVVRHIAHIAELVGSQHICLGCDLDGITSLPAGVKDVGDVPVLAGLLAEAGFSAAEIRAICSENMLKFIREYLG